MTEPKMVFRRCLLAVTLALAACSPSASDGAPPALATPTAAAGQHPVSGLAVVPLTVTTARGQSHAFQVEVARSPAEQAKGLMFRTEMAASEGMIFPMDPARTASFWMKNTVIPLDIIFVGPDGRILNIAANTVPYSEESVASAGPVKAVLELNAGRAAELGIAPGDRVVW